MDNEDDKDAAVLDEKSVKWHQILLASSMVCIVPIFIAIAVPGFYWVIIYLGVVAILGIIWLRKMPRIKRNKLILGAFLVTGFTIISVSWVYKLLSEDVIAEYREDNFHVRIVMEGMPLFGSKYIMMEVTRAGPTYRYPLFAALDFLSDADYRTYEIDSLKLNSSKDLITINFSDGYSIEYPLFLGAFTRNEFKEKWQKINCNRGNP